MRQFIGIIAICPLILAASDAFAQENICAAPLRQALMTVRTSGAVSNSNAASSAWQCSFKFSTHDEAIKAGLDVDTVVYGAPLKIGGKFDKKQVDQWKEENCSKSAQNASFEGSSYNYLREVAPGSMSAFVSCIQANRSTSALSCSLSREPAALEVKWRKTDGELPSAAPKISRVMITNGSCQPGFSAGALVSEGGIGSPCSTIDKKDLLVMIETDRGLCTSVAPYPKKIFTISGKMQLDSDRQISADTVEFKATARIITGGHNLTISASQIDISGGADIIAFDKPDVVRPAGTHGESGGSVVLKFGHLTGDNDLRIDLTGQDGVPGSPGANGGQGSAGGNARGRGLQGFRGCGGGNEADPGGPGGPGQNGTAGGNGGDGGVVVAQLIGSDKDQAELSRLIVVGKDGHTLPGKPGEGGQPGKGGPGGTGGQGDGGHDGCGGRGGAPNGPNGPDGKKGMDGVPGKPGSITIE